MTHRHQAVKAAPGAVFRLDEQGRLNILCLALSVPKGRCFSALPLLAFRKNSAPLTFLDGISTFQPGQNRRNH